MVFRQLVDDALCPVVVAMEYSMVVVHDIAEVVVVTIFCLQLLALSIGLVVCLYRGFRDGEVHASVRHGGQPVLHAGLGVFERFLHEFLHLFVMILCPLYLACSQIDRRRALFGKMLLQYLYGVLVSESGFVELCHGRVDGAEHEVGGEETVMAFLLLCLLVDGFCNVNALTAADVGRCVDSLVAVGFIVVFFVFESFGHLFQRFYRLDEFLVVVLAEVIVHVFSQLLQRFVVGRCLRHAI